MSMPRKQYRGASADEKREKISAIVSMRSLMSPTGMGEVRRPGHVRPRGLRSLSSLTLTLNLRVWLRNCRTLLAVDAPCLVLAVASTFAPKPDVNAR